MSNTIKKTVKRTLFGTLAVMILATAVMVGCDNNPGGGDPPGKNYDPKLILADGFAWVGTVILNPAVPIPVNMAYILKSSGVAESYSGIMGMWSPEADVGTWWTVEKTLFIVDEDGDTTELTYTVASGGNSVTISNGEVTGTFTKTAWPLEADDAGEYDPALLNTMWMYTDSTTEMSSWFFGYEEGDPMALAVHFRYMLGTEDEPEELYYFWKGTENGKIILAEFNMSAIFPIPGKEVTYTYSIAGDVLTIDGKEYTLMDMDDEEFIMFKTQAKTAKAKIPMTKKIWK